MAENKVTSMYPAPMVDVPRPSTIEELVATVAFYGMAEIPADLLATLEDIAADLAEDDGTRRGERLPLPIHAPRRLTPRRPHQVPGVSLTGYGGRCAPRIPTRSRGA